MGKPSTQWCDQCRDFTRHYEVEIKDWIVDGQRVKGAFTLRCENHDKPKHRKKAA